jgi:hypothetical protein
MKKDNIQIVSTSPSPLILSQKERAIAVTFDGVVV